MGEPTVSQFPLERHHGRASEEYSLHLVRTVLIKAITGSDATIAKRAFEAMMPMTKINVAAIESACRG